MEDILLKADRCDACFLILFICSFPRLTWNSWGNTVYPAAQIPMKNIAGGCIPVKAKHIVNNVLPFCFSHLFISFSPVLTPSVHFYISTYKLSASTIDLIVRARMKCLNLNFDLEVCAGCFYCQNSLMEKLNSVKDTKTWTEILCLESSPFSLFPHSFSSKYFHKRWFSFSRSFMSDGKAYQLFCRTRASDREHRVGDKTRVPLPPDRF